MKRRIRDFRIRLALWIAPSLRPKRSGTALISFTVGRTLQDVAHKECDEPAQQPRP